jgi:IrrE N-terminal-like domain
MLDGLERDEIVAVVDRKVIDLLDRAGMKSPPVDALRIAQQTLGMVVCLDRQQRSRGRAQRSGGQRQIYLRPEPSEERHQWTVAHEIGEHLKTELLHGLGVDVEQTRVMTGESLANLLASRLLVPQVWLAADAAEARYNVHALKDRYRTASHEVVALRLLDLPEPCLITILDNGHIYRRRSNAWPCRRALEAPERMCQEYVHRFSRPYRVQDGRWTVHGWPVHQVDWKREILRSVIEEATE